jgi:DNA adenine methylase
MPNWNTLPQMSSLRAARQGHLFGDRSRLLTVPPRGNLLKWIGNKYRSAAEIASYFPDRFGSYVEPFLGSGAVLATLAPSRAMASDAFKPLMEIWQILRNSPETLNTWYRERWRYLMAGDKVERYEAIKASYNRSPNGADLLFLCRTCYGGVVRFRKADGYMSTPCGAHAPIAPGTFARRVEEWSRRVRGTDFEVLPYQEAMRRVKAGDLVYCDPPYSHSQTILYGAQDFDLGHLLELISECKSRGALVALSIDGVKKSGSRVCEIEIPAGLFEREVMIDCGRSMLRRFQMPGQTLEAEAVSDRLLLTF